MKGQLIETVDGWRVAANNTTHKVPWELEEKLIQATRLGAVIPDWVEFSLSSVWQCVNYLTIEVN